MKYKYTDTTQEEHKHDTGPGGGDDSLLFPSRGVQLMDTAHPCRTRKIRIATPRSRNKQHKHRLDDIEMTHATSNHTHINAGGGGLLSTPAPGPCRSKPST